MAAIISALPIVLEFGPFSVWKFWIRLEVICPCGGSVQVLGRQMRRDPGRHQVCCIEENDEVVLVEENSAISRKAVGDVAPVRQGKTLISRVDSFGAEQQEIIARAKQDITQRPEGPLKDGAQKLNPCEQ